MDDSLSSEVHYQGKICEHNNRFGFWKSSDFISLSNFAIDITDEVYTAVSKHPMFGSHLGTSAM